MNRQAVIQAIFDGIQDRDARRDAINLYHEDASFRSSVDILVHWLPLWVAAMAEQAEVDAKTREMILRNLEHGISAEAVRESLDRESLLPPRQTPE